MSGGVGAMQAVGDVAIGRDGPGSGTADTPSRELGRASALAVFCVALALRSVHALEIRTAPFFTYPINDSRSYDEWARRIAAGDWLGSEVFYQAPLYPYLLGLGYRVFGADPLVLRFAQAVLGAAACVLLARATARLVSPRAGLVAGFALAAYAPALFYDGMIGKSVVDGFLLCLALACLSRARPGRDISSWLALGATLGALALTRENALVFPAALVVWLMLPRARRTSRDEVGAPGRFVSAAWLLVGLVAVLLPVALRNQGVAGEFHLTTSQFGPNFYIGNNPTATGRYRALRPGRSDARHERADATALAERALGHTLLPGEVSAYWSGRAFDYITRDPVGWLGLKARVLGRLIEATEWVDSEDLYTHAEHSRVLSISAHVLHFGVIAPLAAFGLVATLASPVRRRALAPLMWMAGAYAATVVAFYVFGRYRYPLVPFALVFAAAGATSMPELLARRRGVFFAASAALLLVALGSNLQAARRPHQQAVTAYNLGRALDVHRRFGEAEAQYRRALSLEPEAYLAANRLGELLQRQERHREAIPQFEHAATLWTRSGKPDLGRGVSLEALGELGAARAALLAAIEREPAKPEPYVRLGYLLRRLGRYDLALEAFERARELAPEHPGALAGSAWILAAHPDPAHRDPNRAVALATRAIASGGRQAALLDALAAATAAAGDPERAAQLEREAIAEAMQRGGAAHLDGIRGRLRLYRAGQSYVEDRIEP